MVAVEEPLHRQLGLRDDELERIRTTLGREPNRTELAMYAAMWSEHCSYKSSKVHLRTLPTEGPAVLVGPGQDAGAVDVGEGTAAVFKMESHSHPSAIEPYQGAATGVGGIVRDIISMGARPVALLDPLRFGPLTDARNRYLFEGVVAGIGGYGNCIGVPTVGGEVGFAEPHGANPAVNVMCVGFAPADRLVTSTSLTVHEGSLMVLYGAATGRDGIGGVSVLASATIEAGSEDSRPSVQIGDPFAGKLLIEASLEMVERGLLEGLQDLGGAGLCCAVSESAARAGMGAVLQLQHVPLREADMEPFEILTSESQERMLAIVAPERLDDVREVCGRWGLESSVIAALVPGDRLRVQVGDDEVARRAGALARRPGTRVRAADVADRALPRRRSDLHPVRRRRARGLPLDARLAERRQPALGVGAVRLARAGADDRVLRRRRRRRAHPRHVAGRGAVHRREGPLRPARPLPRRRPRGRRGGPQRRRHRCAPARRSRTA